MEKFEYNENLGRVIFGRGTLDRLPDEVSRLKASALLLLSTSEQASSLEDLRKILKGKLAGIFTKATMHTPTHITDEAVAHAKSIGADCIVSVGGGSTTGLGNAISLRTGLPHISVPTTYAGSEMTAILGETTNNVKTTLINPAVIPQTRTQCHGSCGFVLITISASGTPFPRKLYTNEHKVEALYATNTNPIIKLFATEGIRALAVALPTIVQDPSSPIARSSALYGARLCGKCLATSTVALHHKICHTIGGSFNLPHAETNAIVLPHALAYIAPAIPEVMKILAKVIPKSNGDAIRGLNALVAELGTPMCLRDLGFKEEEIDMAAELLMRKSFWDPKKLEKELIVTLIRRAWAGEAAKADL